MLKLENVDFKKFQSGYKALIHLSGNSRLDMNNVNFVRVSSSSTDWDSTVSMTTDATNI